MLFSVKTPVPLNALDDLIGLGMALPALLYRFITASIFVLRMDTEPGMVESSDTRLLAGVVRFNK